jgi:tRNA 2-thiouridine synthesizing protein A
MTPPGPTTADDTRPLRELLRVAGRPCAACGGGCSKREAVWSIAMGFKAAPRCLPCLATGLGRDADDLKTQLAEYVRRTACYRRAWAEAERLDGTVTEEVPAEVADAGDTEWDAGPMACGELVMALRAKLLARSPGAVVRVRATDPAAAEDLPAWCRLTGHTLVSAAPPEYTIRRKGA